MQKPSRFFSNPSNVASQANTTALKDNVTNTASIFDNTGINPSLLSALKSAVSQGIIADYYEVYLFNFCSGNNNVSTPTFCSPLQSQFFFNPLSEWGLNSSTVEGVLPSDLKNGVQLYQKASGWMHVAYTVAICTTSASVLSGILAIWSRWGSCITSIVSSASTLFTALAAASSTAIFSTIVGTVDTALKPYDISLSLGTNMLALDWLAVAFSVAATLFWIVSICCCSGKSSNRRGGKRETGNEPFGAKRQPTFPFLNRGYQPLGDQTQGTVPYGAPPIHGERDVEMNDYGNSPYKGRGEAYEPFRHQRGLSAVSDAPEV